MDNLCDLSDTDNSDHNRDDESVTTTTIQSGGQTVTTASCLSTSPLMSPNTSKTLLPQQAIRSELRRDFLRLLSSLHKRPVSLKLYECPLVLSATLDACDHQFSQLLVSNFETPIGKQKYAVIRTADVCELEFDVNHCLRKP